MDRVLITLLGLALLTGCNENSDSDPVNEFEDETAVIVVVSEKTTQVELDENQTKWANANVDAYSYTYSTTCFCLPEEAIVVNVQGGEVASAFFTPSGVMLTADRLAQQRTFDDYFGVIQQGLDGDYPKLDVFYDPQYGFPHTIDIDTSLGIADDEIVYLIGSFQ